MCDEKSGGVREVKQDFGMQGNINRLMDKLFFFFIPTFCDIHHFMTL